MFSHVSDQSAVGTWTDLQAGAVAAHTQPGGAVDVVGGQSCFQVLDEAERLKGEPGHLLLSIDVHHCLAIPVTPERGSPAHRTDHHTGLPEAWFWTQRPAEEIRLICYLTQRWTELNL